MASFTSDRTLAFCFGGKAETPQPFNSGLPQGSPVSPVLFLIYSQALLEASTGKYIKYKEVSYLDDDGVLQLSTAQSFAVRRLQERMYTRLQRGAQLNLPYDTEKSGLIHFWPLYNNQKPSGPSTQPSARVGETEIKLSGSIKHLGVHLDDSLTFHTHTDDAAAKEHQCLGVLSALRHNHRGLSAYTALHLVRTAFLPKILWASPGWWTGSQHILSRLEPVYHRALRWASGLPAYTAIRKLLLLTRSPPLRCTLDYLSTRYAIRLLFIAADHPLQEYVRLGSRTVHQAWLTTQNTRREVNYPTLNRPLSLAAKFLAVGDILEDTQAVSRTSPFPIVIPQPATPEEGPQKHSEFLETLPRGSILLYTDGSKSSNQRCGSAWSVYR